MLVLSHLSLMFLKFLQAVTPMEADPGGWVSVLVVPRWQPLHRPSLRALSLSSLQPSSSEVGALS